MTIHKEGFAIILIAIAILIFLNLLVHYLTPGNKLVYNITYAISAIVLVFILQFFRSPNRNITPNDNDIVAPADGTVVVIEEVEEPEYFQGKRIQVSIFMSPLNAHVNWYPISGAIKYYKYHPGDYLVAWHPKSSTLNERTTVVIEGSAGREVLVRQIAGAVARRIVCYSAEGASIMQGEQMGFIKFGSRVDVFLPVDAKINVVLNQTVKGCLSKIAEFE